MHFVIVISLYLLFLKSPGKNNILYTKFRIHYCTYKSQEQIEDGALEMTKLPVELDEAGENSNAQVIDENLSAEVFDLLWGHDPNAIPTVVDYAYGQIWKQLVFSNEPKKQKLSNVSLA